MYYILFIWYYIILIVILCVNMIYSSIFIDRFNHMLYL